MIDIFGADHGGYVKRMNAAVSALRDGRVTLDVKLTQLVKLYKDGEPFKMSKRAGTFVTLRDVVDTVGADVTRFVMLMRKNGAPLDFDFDKAVEQSKDNPVFYVQYAHARIRSVMRKAEALHLDYSDNALLEDEAEFAVARKIAEWPRLVEIAARNNEPHRIAFYLYELEKALANSDVDPRSFAKYMENFCIGRSFGTFSGATDLRNEDLTLILRYAETTAPTKAKMFSSFVHHVRRVRIQGGFVFVDS